MRDKEQVAQAYYAAKTGTGSVSAYQSLAAAYKAKWGAAGPRSGSPAAAVTSSAMTSNAMSPAADYTSLHLSGYYQVAESPSYYCGPASGYSAMNYLGYTTSNDGQNVPLSQAALAGYNYMPTDYYGATTWGSGDWASGLNTWAGGPGGLPNGAYTQIHNPGSSFIGYLVGDIDSFQPFGADTVEYYNGLHYNNHPNRQTPIGHWLGVFGYDNSGANTEFADSSTSIFPNAARYFNTSSQSSTPSTTSFANAYLATNGIAW